MMDFLKFVASDKVGFVGLSFNNYTNSAALFQMIMANVDKSVRNLYRPAKKELLI